MSLQIVYKPVNDLIPYINNSRTHSDAQIAQIAASIKEFGWTNPILLDGENGIIAGHGRLLAARKLDHTEIPTIELSGLTPAQKKAYVIADNKLALNAGWDEGLLKLELDELGNLDFDLSLIGFDDYNLGELEDNNNPDVLDDGNKNLLIIECATELELQTLFDEMQNRGMNCKIMN